MESTKEKVIIYLLFSVFVYDRKKYESQFKEFYQQNFKYITHCYLTEAEYIER